MSDFYFAGDALEVAEVRTGVITGYDASSTYTVTIGGKAISAAGSGGSVTTAAVAIVALLNASTYPEFAEVTWTNSSGSIIGTADTAGKPFVAVLTVAGGTGTVTDFATTTACTGPSVVCAQNFVNASTGARALPSGSDNVYFQDTDVSLLYSLEALAAVTVTNLHFKASYTGEVGMPFNNTDSASYAEYRPRYFKLGATNCYVGEGNGDGSGRLMLNYGTIQNATTVTKTATPADDHLNALMIKGTHASNVLTMRSGTCDLAPHDDDTVVEATIITSNDAVLVCSPNCTLTTLSALGSSSLTINSAATTLNIQDSATVVRLGSGALTTANTLSGTFDDRGSGAVTNVYVGDGATATAANSAVGKTWANTTVAGNYKIDDPNHRITFTNAIDPGKGSLNDGSLFLGNGRTLLPGAP